MKNQMKLSSEMVAMPVTLQTGENEGWCCETNLKNTEISPVCCICSCMLYKYICMYIIYIDNYIYMYKVCENISCLFPFNHTMKGAKKKKKESYILVSKN